jgi:hypothetical protein
MMNQGIMDGMMWGMGAFMLIGIIVVILLVAALVKYVFFK